MTTFTPHYRPQTPRWAPSHLPLNFTPTFIFIGSGGLIMAAQVHLSLGSSTRHWDPPVTSLLRKALFPSNHQLPRAPQLGLESVGAENAGHGPHLSDSWSSCETNWGIWQLPTQEEVA